MKLDDILAWRLSPKENTGSPQLNGIWALWLSCIRRFPTS